jgi:hypothetical protein
MKSHEMDQIITTRMSATVVADLIRSGITLAEMARALKAREDFLRRVQRKLHSFTYQQVKQLAKLTDLTPQLLLVNSMRPIPAESKELFESTRQLLEVSASFDSQFRKRRKRRSTRSRAA